MIVSGATLATVVSVSTATTVRLTLISASLVRVKTELRVTTWIPRISASVSPDTQGKTVMETLTSARRCLARMEECVW